MTYDFSTIMDRRGKDSIAVDKIPYDNYEIKEGFSRLPMWVADMNFATAPSVIKAMSDRLSHPAFGYFNPSDAYYDSIIHWHETRHGISGMTRECIGYENGVLGGILSVANTLCSPGDYILVHSPTYVGFTNSLTNNGSRLMLSPLAKDEQGIWRMDYEDMDRKLKQYKIHLAIFCSPHNPCGRVWERWEIEKAMEVYAANNCYVISDEIWSDIILEGHEHIPTQSVSEDAKQRTIAMYAPSKTFNLAGLIGSYHVIYNPWLRDRVRSTGSKSHYNSMNVLSMHALIGAYSSEGMDWTDELCSVLSDNVDYACSFILEHFEGVKVARPQGTYMLYLDCTDWCEAHHTTIDELQKAGVEVGVIWQDGRPFHHPCSIRMNLALPHSLVVEAFDRLDKYVFNTSQTATE